KVPFSLNTPATNLRGFAWFLVESGSVRVESIDQNVERFGPNPAHQITKHQKVLQGDSDYFRGGSNRFLRLLDLGGFAPLPADGRLLRRNGLLDLCLRSLSREESISPELVLLRANVAGVDVESNLLPDQILNVFPGGILTQFEEGQLNGLSFGHFPGPYRLFGRTVITRSGVHLGHDSTPNILSISTGLISIMEVWSLGESGSNPGFLSCPTGIIGTLRLIVIS
ncbi:MAG: hypothetical protein ACKO23_08680, partial [Gemmataceae bacterium]